MINDVYQTLIDVLESLDIEVYQRDAVPDVLPETYATFWNVETRLNSFYNNRVHSCIFRFYVTFYSKNPAVCNTLLEKFIEVQNENLCLESYGNDYYVSDKDYTGRNVAVRIIKYN